MNRTKYLVKNTAFGILSKIIALVLGFVSRTLFIHYLGNELLGVNGLYTQILTLLSFAELGFGTALLYAMYKPVAEGNETQIIKLLHYYKKVYRTIALIIAVIGLALIPVLQYIVKGADALTLSQLRLYYCFFLYNTVISYFVSYKYSVVNASQKGYIITNFDTIVNFIIYTLQIIVIIICRNYLVYLIVQSVLLTISRICISIYLNHKVPVLRSKSKERLTADEKKPIIRDVKGLVVHQFASVAVHSTDNIIISAFSGMGVVTVGLISNYNLIMSAVLGLAIILFTSVTASFGNLVASSTIANYRKAFHSINFLNFWIYGFCSVAFFVLLPPFITLWIGKENLIDTVSFLLIIVNCYFQGQSTVYHNARLAKGNFNKDKWLALFQALINLVVSVICAYYLGLVGVYIGTVISRMFCVICRPFSTYKFMFEESSSKYFIKLGEYFLSTCIAGVLTYFATYYFIKDVTFIKFCIAIVITAILPNLLYFILFFRSNEFKDCITRIRNMKKRKYEHK